MLTLFHDKKCCNCFNFVRYILWDFIVLGLVLSWWRIEHVLDEQVDFVRSLPVKKPREKHVGSWRVVPGYQFRECLARRANSRDTRETLCLENFKCNFLTLHLYYIYPHYPQKYVRLFREENPRKVFYNTTHPFLER